MAERYVDAAFGDAAGTATFFLADHYVVYDFGTDRARDGVRPVTSFPPGSASGMPAPFAPVGPDQQIDAALSGRGGFADFRYVFRGGEYARFVPGSAAFDPPFGQAVAGNWGLPAGFTTPNAAWNGSGNRDGFGYFSQGNQYVRYRWADDTVDAGYPKPVSNMIGIPADFAAAGPDAAVDGAGGFAETSYLFLDDHYLRFQWVTSGEPHGDGTSLIQDGWPGLAELLLAGKAVAHALDWLGQARGLLAAQAAGVATLDDQTLLAAALLAHFGTTPADTASLATIDAMLAQVQTSLFDSGAIRFRTDAEAAVPDNAVGPQGVPAAYASPTVGICVTRAFVRRPELNRISSLLHEAVHVHDPLSGIPTTHISEWYLTPAGAAAVGLPEVGDMSPGFATRYDLMPTSDRLHNPSSYATFTRHIHFRADSRELATQ